MKQTSIFLTLFLAGAIMTGCVSSRAGNVYSRDDARRSLTVYYGTVLDVRPVVIEGTKTAAGPLMGGVAGAAVGNSIGGGSGQAIATVVGGIVGALAGGAVEEGATRNQAVEITVKMDSGQIIAVVQEKDDEFKKGDNVRILKSADGTTRVRQ